MIAASWAKPCAEKGKRRWGEGGWRRRFARARRGGAGRLDGGGCGARPLENGGRLGAVRAEKKGRREKTWAGPRVSERERADRWDRVR